jgi:hypothetical protein
VREREDSVAVGFGDWLSKSSSFLISPTLEMKTTVRCMEKSQAKGIERNCFSGCNGVLLLYTKRSFSSDP